MERPDLSIKPTCCAYGSSPVAISCFLTALGGTFYAQYCRYINLERGMGLNMFRTTGPAGTCGEDLIPVNALHIHDAQGIRTPSTRRSSGRVL